MIRNFFFILMILSWLFQLLCFLEGLGARMFIKETLISANQELTADKWFIFSVIK